MGGKASRRKGHQFERDCANAFREIFPNAKRNLEYQLDACYGVDLANTGDYRIQCKKLKKYASISKIEEVKCDRVLGEVPVLITAGDGKEPMAVLPLQEFLNLLSASKAL
jgi:hypothetical protein